MFGITTKDVGVFLLTGNAPIILIWLLMTIRGRNVRVEGTACLVCAAFGVGCAILLHGRI